MSNKKESVVYICIGIITLFIIIWLSDIDNVRNGETAPLMFLTTFIPSILIFFIGIVVFFSNKKSLLTRAISRIIVLLCIVVIGLYVFVNPLNLISISYNMSANNTQSNTIDLEKEEREDIAEVHELCKITKGVLDANYGPCFSTEEELRGMSVGKRMEIIIFLRNEVIKINRTK